MRMSEFFRKASRLIVANCIVLIGSLMVTSCSAENNTVSNVDKKLIVNVPKDVSSINKAMKMVKRDGIVLVSPGVYHESVKLNVEGVTIRGTDRNKVVLDGEGVKSNGIVGTVSGIRVENLTVKNYLLNGVIFTGVTDDSGNGIGRGSDGYAPVDPKKSPPVENFEMRYITAVNNGLYGVYAFNMHSGIIEESYASGSADSGIYVGQCDPCNIVVRNTVTEYNAVGIETANASAPLVVENNKANNNRVGALILSNYQETFAPLKGSIFRNNEFSNNNNAETPVQASGAFGVGAALNGTVNVEMSGNIIENNSNAGLLYMSNVDLGPVENKTHGNTFKNNLFNLVYNPTKEAPGGNNCFDVTAPVYPQNSLGSMKCNGKQIPDKPWVQKVDAPSGIAFLDVKQPEEMTTMPGDVTIVPKRIVKPEVK